MSEGEFKGDIGNNMMSTIHRLTFGQHSLSVIARQIPSSLQERELFFCLRECDDAVVRHQKAYRKASLWTEQSMRVAIRQATLSLHLTLFHASREEIKLLKNMGVLGRRAPSASLLNEQDVIKLFSYYDLKTIICEFQSALQSFKQTVLANVTIKEVSSDVTGSFFRFSPKLKRKLKVEADEDKYDDIQETEEEPQEAFDLQMLKSTWKAQEFGEVELFGHLQRAYKDAIWRKRKRRIYYNLDLIRV